MRECVRVVRGMRTVKRALDSRSSHFLGRCTVQTKGYGTSNLVKAPQKIFQS